MNDALITAARGRSERVHGRVKRLIQLALRAARLWLAINGLRCLLALRVWWMGGVDR